MYVEFQKVSKMVYIIIAIAVVSLGVILSFKNHQIKRLRESIKAEREDAVKRSKSVTRGNIAQEFIPLFPDFPYQMSECRFFGAPLDYIIFENMSAVRDGTNIKINVVFADVKVNTAQKTKVQNAIKDAIDNGRVRFETWQIDENKKIKIKANEKIPTFGPYVPAPLFELKKPG